MKKGFTLLEVNLAIFIMATGLLSMCALFALGFRESRQSVEDVAATAFADAYLGPLVQGLSATNMTWKSWCKIGDTPSTADAQTVVDGIWPKEGWLAYLNTPDSKSISFTVNKGARNTADGVFGQVIDLVPGLYKGKNPSVKDYQYGLVVTRRGNIVQLAFRASKRVSDLLSQPPVVAEVCFQGDVEETP